MFYLFLSHLGIGLLTCLAFVPFRRLGGGFFRFNALLALAFLVVSTAVRWPSAAPRPEVLACALATAAFVVSLQSRRRALSLALLYAAIVAGVATLVHDAWLWPSPATQEHVSRALLVAHFTTSATLLGAVLLDMILGHWYLVIPGLSFGHLHRMTAVLAASLALRFVVTAWGVRDSWDLWATAWQTDAALFMLQHGLFLVLRFVFGILGPAVLIVLVWRCVRIGSNMSATGILYVATAIVLVGEIASLWFLSTNQVPL
jgi:hypothetical protein